jgi:hypothetical protein
VAGADASRNRIYGVCGDDHVTLNHVSVLESDGGMVGININDSAGGLQLRGTAGTWRASTATRRPYGDLRSVQEVFLRLWLSASLATK